MERIVIQAVCLVQIRQFKASSDILRVQLDARLQMSVLRREQRLRLQPRRGEARPGRDRADDEMPVAVEMYVVD